MEQQQQIGLLELPEVVTRQLFTYLGFSDVCRLRLTSKMAQQWSAEAFLTKIRIQMEVTEGTEDKSFESALTIGENLRLIDIDELYVQNETPEVYKSPGIEDFLELFGSRIRRLRVKNYFLDSPAQLDFLNALPNVWGFRIDTIDALGHHRGYTKSCSPYPCHPLPLPSFFPHLTSLKFGTIRIDSVLETDFWFAMIAGAPRLNYLRYPRLECKRVVPGVTNDVRKFDCFMDLIRTQNEMSPRLTWGLHCIDFKNLDNIPEIQQEGVDFLLFVEFIKGSEVELLNVHSEFFSMVTPALPIETRTAFNCVTSIVDYTPPIFILPMENLDRIIIENMSESVRQWEEPMVDWDSLMIIHLNFDRDFVMAQLDRVLQKLVYANLESMYDFLFLAEFRNYCVSELKIRFDPSVLNLDILTGILDARKITEGLSSLIRLTLVGWNPINKAFVRLWNGLPELEELWIEDCPSLGNVGFVGSNLEAPAFLKLKKLQKLTIILDKMPKVTDRCFKDVFRHMRLKEFHLRSSKPLPNITKKGISWLLTGEFATTVERFPFNSWSSTTISVQEMLDLKLQFNSLIS